MPLYLFPMDRYDFLPHDSLTENEVAVCAYLIWLNEGQPEGRGLEHWAQAEAQLLAAHAHEGWTGALESRRP
ncbi:MAG: DUF2934 domain-containing protein [Verrucomicrobiota bacterium]|nr:DUF2934 domain-containing protein [Verrucomicrobiota bacterium]